VHTRSFTRGRGVRGIGWMLDFESESVGRMYQRKAGTISVAMARDEGIRVPLQGSMLQSLILGS